MDDVNRFHELIINDNRSFGKTYNLGSGENYSVNEYIHQAGGITGAESKDVFIIKAHTNQRIKYDNKSKIESGDVLYVVEKINWDRRTKILDTVSVTQAIASTLSMILTIIIASR